jgi:hypothetical protein
MTERTTTERVVTLLNRDGQPVGAIHTCRLLAVRNPFTVERVEMHLATGKTIAELLTLAGLRTDVDYRVFVGDRLIPREWWPRVRPKPGSTVTVRAVPMNTGGGQGDSNKVLRTVLQIVVIVIGIVAIVATYGAATPAVAAGWSAAIAGGVAVANLAINALLPPSFPKPDAGAVDSPLGASITGARNVANPYGAVLRAYGRHRMAPPAGALLLFAELEPPSPRAGLADSADGDAMEPEEEAREELPA